MHLAVEELLIYTDEERQRWEKWFRENGEELLKAPVLGDRETTVGALILNIFGPELRFAQRISGNALSDYRSRPCFHVAELFGFGIESRQELRRLVRTANAELWGRIITFDLNGTHYEASSRKLILHVLVHEIRLWSQIAGLLGERGFPPPGKVELLDSAALV